MRLKKLGIGSESKKLWNSYSVKEKALNGRDSVGNLESRSINLGSKDETFFDSQTWLDSDCEEDFVSANGDFIPSRGSTPNYQINTNGTFQFDKSERSIISPEAKSEPSPTDGKKKLAELLKESQNEELDIKQDGANVITEVNGKPHISKVETTELTETNSPSTNADTPNKDLNHHKQRRMKVKQCCLPSLVHSLSFRERRNRKASEQ
ncbi:hypothetical protein Cni_G11203 [Canna indica]|uniref:Uncharacterized protein n=1 Tax=Canna indica TaxID=4628 RepID=A0AAQ3K675_9LILI|nr:hypothetical protein Cni_G11203 [Canna indica]